MNISVVVPLFNEEESLPELYAWIERVMKANGFSFEVIFVNDGSTDRSWEVIEKLKAQSDCVKGIKFRRNYGKSPALYCGFAEAQGDVVITMDADLQDSPDEIPELYRMITEDGYDLVSGWKQKRYDPLSKTLPTKLFNATARKVSGIPNLHDFNCGLKAYRKDVVKHIEVPRSLELGQLSSKVHIARLIRLYLCDLATLRLKSFREICNSVSARGIGNIIENGRFPIPQNIRRVSANQLCALRCRGVHPEHIWSGVALFVVSN